MFAEKFCLNLISKVYIFTIQQSKVVIITMFYKLTCQIMGKVSERMENLRYIEEV